MGGIAAGINHRVRMRRRDCRIRNLRNIRGWSAARIGADPRVQLSPSGVANVLRRGHWLREVPLARRNPLPAPPVRPAVELPDRVAAGAARVRNVLRPCPRCGGGPLYHARSGQLRLTALSYDVLCVQCGRCPLPPLSRQPDPEDRVDLDTGKRKPGRPAGGSYGGAFYA